MKSVIVAGVGPGIGGMTARYLASRGYRLALISRSDYGREVAEETASWHARCDLLDPAETAKAIVSAAGALGGADAVVHAAGGYYARKALDETDDGFFTASLLNNVKTFYNVVRASAPYFKKRGGGVIVAFSAAPNVYLHSHAGYAAGKGGVEFMVRLFAKELAGDGIRVNCVSPGFFAKTGGQPVRSQEPLQKTGRYSPIHVAQAVEFLIEDDIMTGQSVVVDGGASLTVRPGE
ncbi:MAG: SDR family oxidoreductase [Nitrososphaerota archaeon]|nr:SDR family oxidoreductase [Nitrososphaerota archaeon]